MNCIHCERFTVLSTVTISVSHESLQFSCPPLRKEAKKKKKAKNARCIFGGKCAKKRMKGLKFRLSNFWHCKSTSLHLFGIGYIKLHQVHKFTISEITFHKKISAIEFCSRFLPFKSLSVWVKYALRNLASL